MKLTIIDFPNLQETMDTGFINDCSTGICYEIAYNFFGVYHKNAMYYLSTDPEKDAVVQTMDSQKLVHRKLFDTKIPNRHIGRNVEGTTLN